MKLSKLSLVAALALGGLLACGTLAMAQDNGGGGGGGKKGGMRGPSMEQLKTELKLTDEQVPKVQALLDDTRKKMTDLRADTALSQEDRRTKMMAIRDEQNTKMKAILTPEQFEKYQAMAASAKKGATKKAEEKKTN